MSSSYTYPHRLMHQMTDPLWFPRSKEMTESSLDQLEREEEEHEAKMKGIAEIQASLPIGVTPAIMSRYEKKVQEIRESAEEDDPTRPVVKTLFWNRNRQIDNNNNDATETIASTVTSAVSPPPRPQQLQTMTPLSSRRGAESEFSFGLDTPQSMVHSMSTPQSMMHSVNTPQSMAHSMNTPQSMVSRDDDSSYNLDTSNDTTLQLNTPQSRMSP